MDFTQELAQLAISKRLAKNEHYVLQRVDTIAYIESGYLRSYQIDFRGDDITINLHGPRGFAGVFMASIQSNRP